MLKVGVIGTGMIGQDHIRRMTTVLAGVQVTAVSDVDTVVAASVGAGVGASVHATGGEVIADPSVDAVVVCSWGPTHEEYVLAAIAAGKPVFCEKPLATTQEACLRILDAEVAAGRRLVQVGYMRRYDAEYRALKSSLGVIGRPLMMHCAHRNASVPSFYEKEMAITDTAVHEIDMVRWLFDDEVAAVRVLVPRRSGNGGELQDPLFVVMEMAGGVLVDVEISVNIRYGYDIRGEVVGENGTAALGNASLVTIRHGGVEASPVPVDWRERFLRAYDVEFQEWIDSLTAGGRPVGPSAWDGYAAAVVSDAGVAALRTGDRVPVSLVERPKLYGAEVAAA
ncbi:Gfo/Idh/MocA family oxidoreductase [Paractinoplanes atraurantiacus]|uniref:Inositol 2-dehydrogenase n=1 Tax=Paractinoplanes atraurantiacus TaxID=1036182 RepID=A0A285ILN6_9ACTN|nr:Gfo/Idh/MocA family oxidoreductase [Actinoplanes atraurantiacus]SNY48930.1 myo-inositol 2-dehydrogenase / D-chiro-inositol 1-dehydrogenase [Actinoplanes atraurantiacus]